MQLCWNTKKSRRLVTFCCLRFSFSSCSTLSWDFSQLSPPSKPCNVGGPTWFCNTRLLEAQQGGFGSENFPKYDLTSRNSRYNQHESIQSKFVFASSIFFIFSHWDSDDGVSNGMENMNKVMMGNCTGLPMGRELDSCNFMRSTHTVVPLMKAAWQQNFMASWWCETVKYLLINHQCRSSAILDGHCDMVWMIL